MRQYDIWWVKLPAPVGRRPILLLSRDSAYQVLSSVIIAEITTRVRGIPQEVALGRREGMTVRCVANLDNLHAVRVGCFQQRAGRLARKRVHEVKAALGHVLGWPELVLEL